MKPRKRAYNSTLPAPTKPMPKVNEARRARREAEGRVYSEHHEWIATQPCVLAGLQGHKCMGIVVGHHLKTVGSGGEDRNNQVPVCESAHSLFHDKPLSEVCRQFHKDFKSIACIYTEQFDRENG